MGVLDTLREVGALHRVPIEWARKAAATPSSIGYLERTAKLILEQREALE